MLAKRMSDDRLGGFAIREYFLFRKYLKYCKFQQTNSGPIKIYSAA